MAESRAERNERIKKESIKVAVRTMKPLTIKYDGEEDKRIIYPFVYGNHVETDNLVTRVYDTGSNEWKMMLVDKIDVISIAEKGVAKGKVVEVARKQYNPKDNEIKEEGIIRSPLKL